MNTISLRIIVGLIALLLFCPKTWSQYTFFNPEGSFAIEVSLDNTDLVRLPIYRNAITSLTSQGDLILGGTTAENGLSPFVFIASLSEKRMIGFKDISEIVKGQEALQSGFIQGNSGQRYIGTLPEKGIENSGHLLSVRIEKDNQITIKDLGAPVTGEGVFALTGNDEKTMLYGLTYPSGYLFSYEISTGNTKVFRETAPASKPVKSLSHDFAMTPDQYLSKEIIMDTQGLIYGSLPYGKIFTFDTRTESVNIMEETLPDVWGREAMAQVSAWIKDKNGMFYGANSADGQLFLLDPESKSIKNLGKPIMMSGLPDMVMGSDGQLYGLAGGTPGYSHLFCYDSDRGFKDLGNPEFVLTAPGIEQGINWRGFQLSTITMSEDGKYIIMGENESLSQLMIFPVSTESRN